MGFIFRAAFPFFMEGAVGRLIRQERGPREETWTDYTRILNLLYHRGWSDEEVVEIQAAIDAACVELEAIAQAALDLNDDYRHILKKVCVSTHLPHTTLARHLTRDDDLTHDLRELLRRRRNARGPYKFIKNDRWGPPSKTLVKKGAAS